MFRKNLDLPVVVLLAAIGAAAVLSGLNMGLFGLVFALLLPGYVFSAALFAELEWIARLLVSLALSMAVLILGGMLLNLTPWGLTQRTWVVYLLAATGAGILLVLWRRFHDHRSDPGEAEMRDHEPDTHESASGSILPRIELRVILLLGLAVGFASVSFYIAQFSTGRNNTAFSMLWADFDQNNPALPLRLGVQNEEGKAGVYHLVVEVNGSLIQKWDNLSLANGQRFETKVQFATPPSGPVLVLLYQAAAPDKVYRHILVYPPIPKSGSVNLK